MKSLVRLFAAASLLCGLHTAAVAQTAPTPVPMPTAPMEAKEKAAYWEKQPEMKAAIESLREALRHLKKASGDKGGHRAKAIKTTRESIKSVWAGIKFDNKNLSAAELKQLDDERKKMESEIDAELK